MPSRGWTFFLFFFKLVPEEELSKDCSMKKKPFNDNLVMASIESLYAQASHTVRPNTDGLRRHKLRDLPIIGSLPVQLGIQEGASEYDDIVLTGRLQEYRPRLGPTKGQSSDVEHFCLFPQEYAHLVHVVNSLHMNGAPI